MAALFPTTDILDTCTRADENPATGWTTPVFVGTDAFKILSNKLTSAVAGFAARSLTGSSFGAQQEAYCTFFVTGADGFDLGCCMNDLNTAGIDMYGVTVDPAGTLTPFKIIDGSYTALGSAISQTVTSGDSVGLRRNRQVLEIWYKVGSADWQLIGARQDSALLSGGALGLDIGANTVSITNFGGGEWTEASVFPLTDVLDDCNRADENPLGGSWDAPLYTGTTGLKLVSNKIAAINNAVSSAFYTSIYNSLHHEVYVTFDDLGGASADVVCCASNMGGTATDYFLHAQAAEFHLGCLNDGDLVFQVVIPYAIAAGDSFGLRRRYTTLEVWHKPAGGSWHLVYTMDDNTHMIDGRIGLVMANSTQRFSAFGGGTISSRPRIKKCVSGGGYNTSNSSTSRSDN